jgi:hypothetical protein
VSAQEETEENSEEGAVKMADIRKDKTEYKVVSIADHSASTNYATTTTQ